MYLRGRRTAIGKVKGAFWKHALYVQLGTLQVGTGASLEAGESISDITTMSGAGLASTWSGKRFIFSQMDKYNNSVQLYILPQWYKRQEEKKSSTISYLSCNFICFCLSCCYPGVCVVQSLNLPTQYLCCGPGRIVDQDMKCNYWRL
jgi:hypothetical protein